MDAGNHECSEDTSNEINHQKTAQKVKYKCIHITDFKDAKFMPDL